MDNCFGKMDGSASRPSTPTPSAVSAPAAPGPVVQADPSPLNALGRDLKECIAKYAGPETNKALRLTNKSFRQAGATHVTKLKVPASELGSLSTMLTSLPAVTEVTITGLRYGQGTDVHLEALAQLDPGVLAKIRRVDLCRSYVTDAGIAHLQPLTQLQSLNLIGCTNLTDAGLAHLQPLTQLQSLSLARCTNLTDAGLAHLQPLTQLQSLDLTGCTNLTDAGLDHLQPLTQLQSLDLTGCTNFADAGRAHLWSLTQLQALDL